MEKFSDLLGRQFLLDQLTRPVNSGRVDHAQIFTGPRGTGKSGAAYLVAKAANCRGEGTKPCCKCPSCLRFQEHNAPELTIVEPDGKSIKIEQVRAVIDDMAIRPDGGMKCVIFHDAETITEAAQNALLKTIEEPPEYALFIFVTENAPKLLSTIRSRCKLLRFAPLSDSEIRSFLENRGFTQEDAAEAARAACGSPGRALEIAGDSVNKAIENKLISAFEGIKTPADVSANCGKFSTFKDTASSACEMLEIAASEMMEATELGRKDIGALASLLLKNGIDGAALMKAVIKCVQMLQSNVSFQSAIEMLLFDITTREDK